MHGLFTKKDKELEKIYSPYGNFEGFEYRLRDDAPQEAKDALKEAIERKKYNTPDYL